MIEEAAAIAIDLGGTRTRFAAIRADGTLLARKEEPTHLEDGPDASILSLVRGVQQVRDQLAMDPIGLGVAAPGPVDRARQIVFLAHNLGWGVVRLADELGGATGLRTLVDNDANLAALGEARHGVAQGARNLIYMTVSTGIGAGIIVDGQLLHGARGAAGEAGHTVVWPEGRICHCGNRGCLEAYASGTAIAERAREAIEEGAQSSLAQYSGKLRAEEVAAAARQGDQLACDVIRQAGAALGLVIRNLRHVFDPEIVVLGGGVTSIGAPLWGPMLAEVQADRYGAYAEPVAVVPAALGEDSGLVGAGVWVHEQLGEGR